MRLIDVFDRLFTCYGPQHWWPGDTPFEIMIGAILTQNTAWTNVEKAIANLRRARKLSAHGIAGLPHRTLAGLVAPSGYFNVKAHRLKRFCEWLIQNGGHARVARRETLQLRHDLLSVHGIGHETADDILLYAFSRPVFVIDTYTRRLFSRLGIVGGDEPYDILQARIESVLTPEAPERGERTALFNEYHALIVAHAKQVCRKTPLCDRCCLRQECPSHRLVSAA